MYPTKAEAQKDLKRARKQLALANTANDRLAIQKWFDICEKIRDEINSFN